MDSAATFPFRALPNNIVLIVTDQQSAGTLSCDGNDEVSTPNLDALAEGGVRFDRCYCTFPLCTPSRASLFTGMYPHQVGIDANGAPIHPLFRGREIGTLLGSAGYDCAYAGKWHVPEISMPDGEHGFRPIAPIGDPDLAAAVDSFLDERAERPFFLVVAYDNPHNICEYSHGRPMPWGGVSTPATEDCPNLPINHGHTAFAAETYAELLSFAPLYNQFTRYTEDDWRRYRYVYNRLIERVDKSVGRVLASLSRHGCQENTVVIFTSDHGDMQGAHGFGHKIVLYEEAVRVPLLIRHPGLPPERRGATTSALVSNGLDLLPTICEIAGVNPDVPLGGPRGDVVPGGTYEGAATYPIERLELRGQSLLRDAGATREHLVVETNYRDGRLLNGRAVVGRRYKYAVYNHGRNREQLYDLEDDPGEMRNLAVERRYSWTIDNFRRVLKQWMDETDDRFEGHYAYRGNDPRLPELPGLHWGGRASTSGGKS